MNIYADDLSEDTSTSTSTSTNSADTNTNLNSSSNQSNGALLNEMQKWTTKGLKVFDTLLKDDQAGAFFANVNSSPDSSQFEGNFDVNAAPKEVAFHIVALGNKEGYDASADR